MAQPIPRADVMGVAGCDGAEPSSQDDVQNKQVDSGLIMGAGVGSTKQTDAATDARSDLGPDAQGDEVDAGLIVDGAVADPMPDARSQYLTGSAWFDDATFEVVKLRANRITLNCYLLFFFCPKDL